MSKTITRMEKFLDEGITSGLERFDVPKEVMKDITSLGKDLTALSKRAKHMDGSAVLSKMRDLYDELHFTIEDLESYLAGHLTYGKTQR